MTGVKGDHDEGKVAIFRHPFPPTGHVRRGFGHILLSSGLPSVLPFRGHSICPVWLAVDRGSSAAGEWAAPDLSAGAAERWRILADGAERSGAAAGMFG